MNASIMFLIPALGRERKLDAHEIETYLMFIVSPARQDYRVKS